MNHLESRTDASFWPACWRCPLGCWQAAPRKPLTTPASNKKVAAIVTAYHRYSHADNIVTRFMEGYSIIGKSYPPPTRVASLYIDQTPTTTSAGRWPITGAFRSSSHRRRPDARRRQAGGGWRAPRRRTGRLSLQRQGTEALSAPPLLRGGGQGLSRRASGRCRSSWTSTCRTLGRREVDVRPEPGAGLPDDGRLVDPGDVSPAGPAAEAGRGMGRPCRWVIRRLATSTTNSARVEHAWRRSR